MPDERDEGQMVRIIYCGESGKLDEPRLGGMGGIPYGHALDVPKPLARELVAGGFFAWPAKFKKGEPVKAFTEIRGDDEGLQPALVEITDRSDTIQKLTPGLISGLGSGRLDALAEAGIVTVQGLAGLHNEACDALGAELDGVSGETLRGWRDAARRLMRQTKG